jgi:hypothetical protein
MFVLQCFKIVVEGVSILAAKKLSIWSASLSLIGIILFLACYLVSENPTSGEVIIIKVLFFSGIASMIIGIVASVSAIKSMEKGILKYFSFFIAIFLIIGVIIAPIIFMAFGFGEK